MTLRWAQDTWVLKVSRAVNLWHAQVQRPAYFPLSPLRTPHCRLHVRQPFSPKVDYLIWKHAQTKKSRGHKGWLCRASQLRQRLALHTNTYRLSSSTSRWSALSQHMSRIRSTLDSVSKAVSGTHSDLISKIARLKPNAVKAGAAVENSPEVAPQPQVSQVTSTIPEAASDPVEAAVGTRPTLSSASASSLHATPAITPINVIPTTTLTSNVGLAVAAGRSGGEFREKRLRRVPPAVRAAEASKAPQAKPPENEPKSTAVSKQTTPLFHPSSLSVNLDETYNYLAHHVNAYFGSSTKADGKKADGEHGGAKSYPSNQPSDLLPVSDAPGPSAAASPKKGIGHYLSYSAPTVQAFVGNYIAPLVPKFRTEAKSAAVEKEKLLPAEFPAKQEEVLVNKEQKASEEKAKRLLLQREKIIARLSIDNRTRALVQALHRASDVRVYINRVEDLSYHLLQFPETRGVAVKEKAVQCLLRLRQASDPALKAAVSQALTLVGYTNPVNGRGIRILSIDGGGTRGLIALQTLHKLEALTGKPIHQLFDYICGVSTGAILGFMLGVFQIPLDECDDLYRKLGSDVFKQNVFVGTMKMGWNHAFYDSETWENILKEKMGSDLLVETTRNPDCPKVAAVSTIVNQGSLKAFVFRNYNLQPGVRSHYLGGCQHKLWQAIRASSAAPGYFQEFPLGNDLHQDGGLLVNNPTALAIHECKCLWPNTPVQCVVSLGTGRHQTGAGRNNATSTSLKTKISNVISSATDTEEVHTMLDALLPPDTYYRFNPYMNEEIPLDERRHEKFNLLQAEGMRYLERNEEKLRKAARILTQEKSRAQRLADWLKLKADMYDGMPSFSLSKL